MRVALLAAAAAAAVAQQPDMVHIHLTGKDGELSIDFVSHEPNCTGYGVQYGTDVSKLQYVPSYNCSDFSSVMSAPYSWLNQVLLTGLQPDTTYYYIAGSTYFRMPWSQVYQFHYKPSRTGGDMYAIYADFGYYNDESMAALTAEALEGGFDYVVHAGDFAYDLDTDHGAVGDDFLRAIEPFASRYPYFIAPGNHEVANNFSHYSRRFASVADNAGVNSGSGTNLYWSIDVGMVHWLFWDTESWWSSSVGEQEAQVNWITADLQKANANRDNVPWIVSVAHKAWYMDDTLQPGNSSNGGVVWQMLQDAGVDLHFCGHVHEYRRFLPIDPTAGVFDSNCSNADHSVYSNPKYVVPIVSGAPGDQEVNARKKHEADAVRERAAAALRTGPIGWQTSTNNYGYGHLQIVNATHAHWTFNTTVPHVNSTNPNYSDDLWIVAEKHGARV